jgi:HPr kinase/phosphorylase
MTSSFASNPPHDATEQRLHATCIAIAGKGVLLRGPSGAGKSDLALRLISQSVPLISARAGVAMVQSTRAQLVADDQVIVSRRDGTLRARPPGILAGKLEVRGIGIVEMPHVTDIAITLVVDLIPTTSIERLPEFRQVIEINSIVVPWMALAPFEASVQAKLALALASLPPIS